MLVRTSDSTLVAAFAQQVAARPDDVAVVAGESVLTYRDLDARANRLAEELAAAGVGPGSVVPVLMQRSADLVTAFLGVLKAGGAYLPLDAAHPIAYLETVLNDGTSEVLVVDRALSGHDLVRQETEGARRIISATPTSTPAPNPGRRPRIHPSDLAYVMHTSGSTGAPKGVEITHQAVVELALDPCWEVTARDRVLFQAPHAFDGSTYEIWAPLLAGGRVVVAPLGMLNAARLQTLISEHGVTRLSLTAGLFRVLAEDAPESFAGLAEVTTGGDVVSPAAVHRVLDACPGIIVRTTYGPTEMTLCVTHHPWRAAERPDRSIPSTPLGEALEGTRLYVLDDELRPVPPGETGELCLAGAGTARGYRGRPDLTAERFVADPFTPGERMYRTGDLARWTHERELIFLGRADGQVKIRGFRVEVGEAEAALVQTPGVGEAVVVIVPDAHGDKRLIGFYTVRDGAMLDGPQLTDSLCARLPRHLVPAALIPIAELPLTGNGKVDRAALAATAVTAATAGKAATSAPTIPPTPPPPVVGGLAERIPAASAPSRRSGRKPRRTPK